jgi:hypothetical protein
MHKSVGTIVCIMSRQLFTRITTCPYASRTNPVMACSLINTKCHCLIPQSNYVSPHFGGKHIVFVLSVRLSVTQFVSATSLKLLNRISWNLVGSKDTICSCAYYQEILVAWILWELCPFELRNFPNILLKQLVSTTPLKLLNRISWNLVGSKCIICSCAYYQVNLIAWILWGLCTFERSYQVSWNSVLQFRRSCADKLLQKYISGNFYVQRGITLTKFRRSNLPGNMHNYIW